TVPQVRHSTGGIRRAYYQEEPSWWRRLQISERQGQLVFSNLTNRARAEVSLQAAQRQSVEHFVQGLTKSTSTNIETSVALYEMLVPHDLKERARERGNLVLVLDAHAARYPWELMQEKYLGDTLLGAEHERPRAVESGIVRQLQISDFRVNATVSRSNTVLVIGDPPSHLPPLLGARREAREIAQLLADAGYTVTDIIRREDQPDSEVVDDTILKQLFAYDYRIVHLAGHGMYREATGPAARHAETGMAIGPQRWLTVEHIKSVRPVPEIVFVNCCHLGQTAAETSQAPADFPRLASNIGGALIAIGVKVVVAAGWAVEDAPARCFATTFYATMLQGMTFGDAVRQARERTYTAYPAFNTWGAYQCYGDPAYRMTAPRVAYQQRRYAFSSWMELVIELHNMVERAKNMQPGEQERLAQDIEAIVQAVPAPWLRRGALRAALGAAYSELQDFASAMTHYGQALVAEDGQTTLHAVEQLCNCQVRHARTLPPDAAMALLQEATQRLEALCAVSPTSERHSLLASAAKRQFMLTAERAPRHALLQRMAEHYAMAYELSRQTSSKDFAPYPLVNYLAVRVVLERIPDIATPPIPYGSVAALLHEATQAGRERDQHTSEFWNAVVVPDCQMVQALCSGTFSPQVQDDIMKAYQRALTRSGSPRERDSVVEQYTFLRCAVGLWGETAEAQHASQALQRIVQSLQTMPEQ
ncbi:MAG: CHAT domain-containing protein, partial [Candidatus Tectomicrobia bacterium]|nr:CHAT domain-containing protein [Candidatus Tectomicrobia bacterium]